MNKNLDNERRFALIGCGAIANKHVKAIQRIENACVVGGFDIDPESALSFEKKHHIPTFSNIEEMVDKTNPDVFNILTPSGLHAQNILELIPFNKHFVVEKPLALRLDHIDQIIEKCDKRGIKIFVVQQNRFNPPVKKLKEALDKGRFGKLVLGTVRIRWCREQSAYFYSSYSYCTAMHRKRHLSILP